MFGTHVNHCARLDGTPWKTRHVVEDNAQVEDVNQIWILYLRVRDDDFHKARGTLRTESRSFLSGASKRTESRQQDVCIAI